MPSLADQLNAIRALKSEGKSLDEIAAATGVGVGDVQAALAGSWANLESAPQSTSTAAAPLPLYTKRPMTDFADSNPHLPTTHDKTNLVIVYVTLGAFSDIEDLVVTLFPQLQDGSWSSQTDSWRIDVDSTGTAEVQTRHALPFIVPPGIGYMIQPSTNATVYGIVEQPLG